MIVAPVGEGVMENWANHSHQELYDMVRTNAAGPGALEAAEQAWARFAAMMEEAVDDVRQALADAGVSWEGLAAESMRAGVTPLAVWAEDAATAGAASGGSVRAISESFGYTANAMPEPVAVSPDAFPTNFPDVFAGQIDQDRQERAAQEAKQRAVELMQHYSNVSDAAVISVGTFVPPHSVTVQVPQPDSTNGPPIERTDGGVDGPRSGKPTQPTGPSSPLDAGTSHGGSPNMVPDSTPSPNGGRAVPEGRQTTTPELADPVERAPVPARGGPVDGPSTGGFTSNPVPGLDPVTGRRLGAGAPNEPGRGRAEDGHQAGRGALTGPGPTDAERGASGRVPAATARTGPGGPAMAPWPAGTRREEDHERRSPDYLRDYYDEFWDGGLSLAPPVLGDEDAPPHQ